MPAAQALLRRPVGALRLPVSLRLVTPSAFASRREGDDLVAHHGRNAPAAVGVELLGPQRTELLTPQDCIPLRRVPLSHRSHAVPRRVAVR